MIQYSLEVAICWSVLYLVYIIFLKRETFFSVNRVYLLGSLMLGLIIPFIRMIDWQWQRDVVLSEPLEFISVGPSYIASTVTTTPVVDNFSISPMHVLMCVYIIGALFMTARFLFGMRKIYRLYTEGTKTKKDSFILVETNSYHLPFSFLNYVFFSKAVNFNEEIKHIIHHELTHIKSRHSLDVLFIEALHILFWWNPLIYLYKKEIRQVHEYAADAMVLTDTNQKIYGQILLGQSESGLEIALAHHFFHSHLKQRIMMMYKEKSGRSALVKYLLAVPFIILLAFIFSSYLNIDDSSDWAKTMKQSFKVYEIQPENGERVLSTFIKTGNFLNDNSINKELVIKYFKDLSKTHNRNFEINNDEQNSTITYSSNSMDFIYDINKKSKTFTFKNDVSKMFNPFGIDIDEASVIKLSEHDKSLFLNARNYTTHYLYKDDNITIGCCNTIPATEIKADEVFILDNENGTYDIFTYGNEENTNNVLLSELNDFFHLNTMSVGTTGISETFFKLRKKYPDQLHVIEKRFHEEAVKTKVKFSFEQSDDSQSFKMIACGEGEDYKSGLVPFEDIKFPNEKDIHKNLKEEDDTFKKHVKTDSFPNPNDKLGLINYLKKDKSNTMVFIDDIEVTKQDVINQIQGLTFHSYNEFDTNSQRPIMFFRTENNIYKVTEVMPRFPGCEDIIGSNEELQECSKEKLLDYIYSNLEYPEEAKKNGTEGLNVIQFIIDTKGNITEANVVRDIGDGTGAATLKIVESMPQWRPAYQQGKVVPLLYTLPVRFKLDGPQPEKDQGFNDNEKRQGRLGITYVHNDFGVKVKTIEEQAGTRFTDLKEDDIITALNGLPITDLSDYDNSTFEKNTEAQSILIDEPTSETSIKTDPLFVIDGVIKENKAAIGKLNPNDIIKIDILKDQSAIDKYGQKAIHGVVEITTKKGARKNKKEEKRKRKELKKQAKNIEQASQVQENIIFPHGTDHRLIVIDGKPGFGVMHNIDIKNITGNFDAYEHMSAEKAVKKYGENGRYGAILIYTKNYEDRLPLIVINDEIIGRKVVDMDIAASDFKIKEFTKEEAMIKYGDLGKYGAIEYSGTNINFDIRPDNISINQVNDEYYKTVHGFELLQNKPNPVADQTVIEFKLPQSMKGSFTVFNAIGEKVYELEDEFTSNVNSITIDKTHLNGGGVYYYTLEVGDWISTKKMIVE